MALSNYSTQSNSNSAEKTAQKVGNVKRTLGTITCKVNHEELFKSKIELWLQWGRKKADFPIEVSYGVPKIDVDESKDDFANLGNWAKRMQKEQDRHTLNVTRILETFNPSDKESVINAKKVAKQIVGEAYIVSCYTELADPDSYTDKKYEVDFEGTPIFYADTDTYVDNNQDLVLTGQIIQFNLYNFTTEVYTRLGKFMTAMNESGSFEGNMYQTWGNVVKAGKHVGKQFLNVVNDVNSIALPSKGNDGKIYYNIDSWDSQYIFQKEEIKLENEVGVVRGLVESPTKYEEKFALRLKSQVEIAAELVVEDTEDQSNEPTTTDDSNGLPF